MANQPELEPWNQLDGKIVLVTGASSGLGRGYCLDLAKVGCKIVAAARRTDRLKSLCDQINQLSSSYSSSSSEISCSTTDRIRAVAVELDVTADAGDIEVCVNRAWEAFGHIDALVNNAGIRGQKKSSLDLSEEEWNSTFRTNLTGAWLVSKYVGLKMRDAGKGGSIINISSIASLNRATVPGGVAYGASKSGVDSMTRMMALELGEYQIRVNAIAPGLFRSEITEGLLEKDWLDTVAKKTLPLRTFGTSDPALTSLVRYLIHESSSYVTGNVFIVDAGNTLPGVPIFSSL
ncbi:OLC1v1036399C2 [Oldenlandia corymbosa var. corymbosa]|uniref:OLC1v1036399C2 n=1 Tax=Oldenlandia corymbosa var. corymbosa TaxID=529605 RepID=A0AAV1CW26_OLDCO|nr:OLC1v1036399C2 [Oldenlandia corymbosa var. corymbosa]